MVWVHDHTMSLLLLMMMHMPIVFDQFVPRPDAVKGADLFTNLFLFGVAVWIIAGVLLRLDDLKTQSRGKSLAWRTGNAT